MMRTESHTKPDPGGHEAREARSVAVSVLGALPIHPRRARGVGDAPKIAEVVGLANRQVPGRGGRLVCDVGRFGVERRRELADKRRELLGAVRSLPLPPWADAPLTHEVASSKQPGYSRAQSAAQTNR